MSRKYELSNLTKLQLKRLRQDIVLNSLYLNDYENRYNLNVREVCTFFEGYIDELVDMSQENKDNFDCLAEVIEKYDNIDNLYDWYCCIDWGF